MTANLTQTLSLIWEYRAILFSSVWIEIKKRNSAYFLGLLWLFIYPALFLGMYMFLYMVVFKIRLPEFSDFTYVVLIFSGLVPYLALMEAASICASVIKQNIHYIKNMILPAELVPVRAVGVAVAVQIPGLIILMILLTISGDLSLKAFALPIAIAIEIIFLMGLGWWLAGLGVMVPDLQASINIILIFLLFVSPIAFTPEMVPESMKWVVALNPMAYLMDLFRAVLLENYPVNWRSIAIFTSGSVLLFVSGAIFFRRYRSVIVDNE